MPKFSLIIPVYNVQDCLAECLDSCINQTFRDIEIICINDCSPDDSYKILANYAKKDSRIKVINHERNKGLGGARNTGTDYAQGEYIWFIDSDDWIALDACEKIHYEIMKYNPDMLIVDAEDFDDRTKLFTSSHHYISETFKNVQFITSHEKIIDFVMNAIIIQAWFKIIRAGFYNHFKFLEKYQAEDIPLFVFFFCTNSVVVIPSRLYNYRINRIGSIMTTSNINLLKGVIVNTIRLYELIDSMLLDETIKNAVKELFANRLLLFYYNEPFFIELFFSDANILQSAVLILKHVSRSSFFEIKGKSTSNKLLYFVLDKIPQKACPLLLLCFLESKVLISRTKRFLKKNLMANRI